MKNRVGLGTFPLANVFSEISTDQAKDIVRQFIQTGGYYIDTAPMYGFGEVELLLGEVLKEFPRDSFYLITKCGYKNVEGKTFQTIPRGATFDDVIKECDDSLQRLKIDVIDLYFVHSPDPVVPFGETMEALYALQKQGKIKEIGVSNVSLKELQEYNKDGRVKYIQNRFSLINRSIDKELENYLLDNKIGVIPYQVIDRGQLSEGVTNGITLRSKDLRIGRPDWEAEQFNVVSEWAKKHLHPIAQRLKVTLEQLSIAWALAQPYLSFVIVGATKQKNLQSNLDSSSIFLDNQTLKEINDAYTLLEVQVKDKYGKSLREFRGLNEKYF